INQVKCKKYDREDEAFVFKDIVTISRNNNVNTGSERRFPKRARSFEKISTVYCSYDLLPTGQWPLNQCCTESVMR
ncbi:hypothetical protein Trydic_g11041, partial [Trypoxylus dichotomus]